MSAEGAVHGRG